MITPSPIIITQDGFNQLEEEKEKLLKERPEAVADLKKAREMGDLSENGYYKSARSRLSGIDARLRHLTYVIRFAKVVPKITTDIVGVNTFVLIDDGQTQRGFHIVGEHEANPLEGKISHKSPLGSMLLGKKKGETVSVDTPQGVNSYTIISIS